MTLQRLALTKLTDAELLLQHQRYSNAYYLGGYAAEIGLKAALTRQFSKETLPDRRFVNDAYTHKLTDLVRLAGLQAELRRAIDTDATCASNWSIIASWDEASRYESIDSFTASGFMSALTEPSAGVFQWLKKHW